MTRETWAEKTSNPEAQRLIAAAKSKCAGCRGNWRIDKRTGRKHRHVPGGLIECTAQTERAQLREIAAPLKLLNSSAYGKLGKDAS